MSWRCTPRIALSTTSNEEEGFANAVERFILPAARTSDLTRHGH